MIGKILPLLSLLLLLVSCTSTSNPALVYGDYTIQTLRGNRYDISPAVINIQEGRISGQGPVNRWSAPLVDGNKIGSVISTRMAGSPEKMEAEQQLLSALEGSIIIYNNKFLTLVKEGNVLLTASPASQ